MSRLIDADELVKRFEEIENEEDCIGLDFVAIVDEIKEHPTAYDVDKVVEELEKEKFRLFLTVANTGDAINDEIYRRVGDTLDKAIEIVKKGADNDH